MTNQTQESVPMALDGMETPDEIQALPEPRSKTEGRAATTATVKAPSVPAIYASMSAVMGDLGILTPDATGPTQHNAYPYLSIEKLVGHLRPLLVKHGIVIESRILKSHEEVVFGQTEPLALKDKVVDGVAIEGSYWRGTVPPSRTRAHVIVEYHFISIVDGSRMTSSSSASSADTGDKALRKAMSTVFKQALLHTFAVASKEPELDGTDVEEQVEVAGATAALRSHGQQKVDGARGKTTPRKPAAEKPTPAAKPAPAEEPPAAPVSEPERAPEPGEAPAAPSAPAGAVDKNALVAAKAAFREAQSKRNADPDTRLSMVQVDKIAENVTGKKREDWVKSPELLAQVAEAIARGDMP